ncbi:FkbM family methyltransferase [Saccharicrinis fermentans]|uniref:2-O-methyltransferase NoeI n=1 Tax=Saccharicrinis fermentans DSM 9555 = JCM 21142 TaxID=869213 RepID=W7Y852_9BACT|nr:FkbM family methyltransferase [Saccharicrinis fermentans]GAF04442.1 2-O-methyltransferase NoeI [Saccharicrinis fermentans DSM 9555 = JCM 21142]
MNSKLTRLYYILNGKFKHITQSTHLKKTWYGNKGGGFYVAHQFINQNSVVYSFGIGEDISFDRCLIENHSCTVFAFDPTPKSIAWCKNQVLPTTFYLKEYGIALETGKMPFHLPKNKTYISGSLILNNGVSSQDILHVQMKSFIDIANELGHKNIDLLKMDIEGSEYDVIDGILNSDIEIKQIVVEFHERFFQNGKQKTCEFIQKMKSKGYHIFGISDIFEEVSFVKL